MVVCFFGDAATNQGTFHEAMNMSKAFHLPIVWVCENNLYGLSTPIEKVSATATLADRAKGYAMPGFSVDGMDVEAVRAAAVDAVARARAGEGPTLPGNPHLPVFWTWSFRPSSLPHARGRAGMVEALIRWPAIARS